MSTAITVRRLSAVLLLSLGACTAGTRDVDADSARGAVAAADDSRPGAAPGSGAAVIGRGDSLLVTVEETVRPVAPSDSLSTVEFRSGAGMLLVEWALVSGPCMLAEPVASRTGDALTIRVVRRGDPVALCQEGEVVYQYRMRVGDLPTGQYQVTLVEAPLGAADRTAGTGTVSVTAAGR